MSATNVEWRDDSGELSLQMSTELEGQISYLVTLCHQESPLEQSPTPLNHPHPGSGCLMVSLVWDGTAKDTPCQGHTGVEPSRVRNPCEDIIHLTRYIPQFVGNMTCQKDAAFLL